MQGTTRNILQDRGFLSLIYNELRDNIEEMLEKVTSDLKIEPALQPLSGEEI